ncbi:MAG: hypothetical protein AB4352_13275 [Hormoscilla sp.]
MNNSLLALLLTLPDREPLTPEEQKSLQKVGVQLDTAPEAGEQELIKIIKANPTWHQQFTTTKAQLEDLGENNIQQLLFPDEDSVERGRPKGDPNDSSYGTHIKNFSMSILESPDPQSECKECQENGFFDELIQKLRGAVK